VYSIVNEVAANRTPPLPATIEVSLAFSHPTALLLRFL